MCNINKTIKNYSISLKYDLRPIDKNHPLHEHINKEVNLGNGETTDTYLKYAGVVFDADTKNFHIFPECIEKRKNLSRDFAKIRDAICFNLADKTFPLNFSHHFNITEESKKKFKNLNERHYDELGGYCKGIINKAGSSGNIKALEAIEGNNAKEGNGIYKYIDIPYNGYTYRLNFMRYFYNNNGKIGCTMRAIQFHKIRFKGINQGKGAFDICYPSTDKDDDFRTNNAGNICYNPPVVFPTANSENYNEQITKIANCFIKFIRKYNNNNSK